MDHPLQFSDKIFRQRNPEDELEIQLTKLHISIFDHYFLYLSRSCDFGELRLEELLKDTLWTEHGNSEVSAKIPVSFAQELQRVFVVPRLKKFHQSQNSIKKHQLVEAFISFLLQLLYHKTGSIIDSCNDRFENLEKEMRFLHTVLGDTSLMRCADDEHQEFQELLAKFQAVANEAGSLLHFLLFSTDPALGDIDEAIGVVLNHINLLKADIMKFLPLVSRAYNINPESSVMDSLHIVDSLIYDLKDLLNRESSQIAEVKDQIKDLHEGLTCLQSSIKEVGAPQSSETGEFKETLMRIGDVAHEAEYLIISFLTGDAPLWYLNNRLTSVNHKIELIATEQQQIIINHKSGDLLVAKHFSSQPSLQATRNTEVDDGTVGFEDKEIYILDKLVGGGTERQFISIFGMPGIGKTTLAKKLYSHPLVNDRFDKLSWCVVSQTYQIHDILANILTHIASGIDKVRILTMGEESLLEHIHKTLTRRRYLVVLDDIWESDVLDDLVRCFPDDRNGSRIMFTTRIKDVTPPNSITCALPRLSNDQCWKLLEKKVFINRPCPPELHEIGKRIAENCHGLPLAVVVIAGILSTMDEDENTWEKVRGNLASYIFDGGDDSVMRILKLSYKHLPQRLKPCFLYFGALQKEKEITVGRLVRLWIAEGFIRKEKEENLESVAEKYLTELIDRSLVMIAKRRSDGGVKTCHIHDLLRDLCLKTCEEENFLKFEESNNCSIYNESGHLQALQYSVTWSYCQNMRSLFGRSMMLPLHIREMRLLRVLHFDCRSTYLTGIGFLVCLRYLVITDLAPSVGSLVNLEYLRVETNETVYLSSAIIKMKKLRYIFVGSEAIYGEDCSISQRNNFEFLSYLGIREPKDEEMLKCSPHLRKLKLSTCRHVDLSFLDQLESLSIRFYNLGMEGISFPSNIKKLTLFGSRLTTEEMSLIGRMEKLEVLKLGFSALEEERWDTRDGEFQKIKFLKMKIENLTEWNVALSEHFPKLEQLVLSDCGNLQEIPTEIFDITTLQLIEVQGICTKSLLDSAKTIQQEQLDMKLEEPRIITKSAQLLFEDNRNPEGDDVSIGFEDKAIDVLEWLISGTKSLQVISITGMAGVGKTTLAKKLYNHPSITYYFDVLSWCVVSQTYLRPNLLTKILIPISRIEKERILIMDEESLIEHIWKSLKGRRYLVVLDDVWDSRAWDALHRCFPDDANGSRILFTTRNYDVAPPSSIVYKQPPFSDDQCWELLQKKVFDDERCPPELIGIGAKIAANCCGLPLAVIAIAGILSTVDKEKSTWEEVGENLTSYIFNGGNNSLMELSYQHLPKYLKPCMLYFGVFNENEEIPVRELLRFWISEGFIAEKEEKSVENIAEEYLMQLIDKSLVAVAKRRSDGGVKTCVIHDFFRHWCLQKCEEENFEILTESEKYLMYKKGHRRLQAPFSGRRWTSPSYVSDTRLLRVLHCDYINSRYIGIEFLVCLRFLVISELPPSIGGFVNLEYLRVETYKRVVYLPSAVMKMKKLRCIQVDSEAIYDKDCDSTQLKNNLEFLSRIWIREPKDNEMLKCSPRLRKLKLSKCGDVDLSFLNQLESLDIRLNRLGMDGITFSSRIRKLTLSDSRLTDEDMHLIGRFDNLELLKLISIDFEGEHWDTRDDEFQRLKFFKLSGTDLARWNVDSSAHIPLLQRLVLINCRNLQEVPPEVGEIPTLMLIEVQGICTMSLVKSARRIQQEQLGLGSAELRVIYTDICVSIS